MKKVLVICNALAGDGRSRSALDAARILDDTFERVVVPAESVATVSSALAAIDPANTAGVVVVGGDGTVNRWLTPLLESRVPVAIFPAGTVNDLALTLGMTSGWEDLKDLLRHQRHASMPVLRVNSRPFAVYGALGLGAETSRNLRRLRVFLKPVRRLFPLLLTPLVTTLTVLSSRSYQKHLRLTLDGADREVWSPGIYVANQRYVNRRLDLEWRRPEHSRQFRLIMFKPLGRLQLLDAVSRFNTTGRLSAIRGGVDIYDIEHAVIESVDGSPIHFVADGEPMFDAPRVDVSVAPQPLHVYRRQL